MAQAKTTKTATNKTNATKTTKAKTATEQTEAGSTSQTAPQNGVGAKSTKTANVPTNVSAKISTKTANTPTTTNAVAKTANATTNTKSPANAPMKALTNIINTLFCSVKIALVVAGVYAVAIGVATFIENDFGAAAARELIYNAWWFDLLHLWLLLLLIGCFIASKAWARKKWASLFFHASLILIILGAGVTRFWGFEGTMSIKEGAASNFITTNETYIMMEAQRVSDGAIESAFLPTSISPKNNKKIKEKIKFFNKSLELESLGAKNNDETGLDELLISVKIDGAAHELTLFGGNPNMLIPTSLKIGEDIALYFAWGNRRIALPFAIKLTDFVLTRYPGSNAPSSYSSFVEVLDGGAATPFHIYMNHVLDHRGYRFFQSSYFPDESGTILSVNNDPGKWPTYAGYAMMILGIFWLLFDKNGRFRKLAMRLEKQKLFGFMLAFGLVLGAFGGVAQAYPVDSTMGAKSAESGAESVKVDSKSGVDSKTKKNPHEKIAKDSINESAKNESAKKESTTKESAQDSTQNAETKLPRPPANELIALIKNNSKDFSKKFGKLLIQDFGGRTKPLDTLAMEYAHKMTKKDNFLGLGNTQLILAMMIFPDEFQQIAMLKISTDALKNILNIPQSQKFVAFKDVFFTDPKTGENTYALANYLEDANRKKPSERNTLDKDLIALDERVNVAYMVYSAEILKIFPTGAVDEKNAEFVDKTSWNAPIRAMEVAAATGDAKNLQIIASITKTFGDGVERGMLNNDWADAEVALSAMEKYQQLNGADLLVDSDKIAAEIFLNHANIFNMLTLPFILLGVLLFIFVLAFVLRNRPINRVVFRIFYSLGALLLVAQSAALILRWYVSGHAPWSNAYESMLYIAWASAFAGIVCFRRSVLALSASLFFAGICLFVAHLGFMDPQIGNLVPVLKSYWLNIHVSVITASYGFLGLSFMLGALTLIMYTLRSPRRPNVESVLVSLVTINEMCAILGLFLLLAGNFLGGVWANESWGRYWGWDSKETWSLVTIGVYMIVTHLRFVVSAARINFVFSAASVVAFFSVLMTYFGVNYYLSGMHSYAAGDPLPIPPFLYFLVAGVVILIVWAGIKSKNPKQVE